MKCRKNLVTFAHLLRKEKKGWNDDRLYVYVGLYVFHWWNTAAKLRDISLKRVNIIFEFFFPYSLWSLRSHRRPDPDHVGSDRSSLSVLGLRGGSGTVCNLGPIHHAQGDQTTRKLWTSDEESHVSGTSTTRIFRLIMKNLELFPQVNFSSVSRPSKLWRGSLMGSGSPPSRS